jgi:hypothetical protein
LEGQAAISDNSQGPAPSLKLQEAGGAPVGSAARSGAVSGSKGSAMPATNRHNTTPDGQDFEATVAALDWARIEAELDAHGVGLAGRLLDAEACAGLRGLYAEPARFRSRIVMARHGFGRGEYQYFAHPLPRPVAALRPLVYARLAPIANRWNETLGIAQRYPESLDAFLALCHRAGQQRPTPLLLKYEVGDYNCLHQDLYGDLFFPFQMVILLSQPGRDFTGGEFTLVEQRPRMQSRPEVVPLVQGEAAIFAVQHRPVAGTRGSYRVNLRHGVSRVRSGERYTTGLIFHDAR